MVKRTCANPSDSVESTLYTAARRGTPAELMYAASVTQVFVLSQILESTLVLRQMISLPIGIDNYKAHKTCLSNMAAQIVLHIAWLTGVIGYTYTDQAHFDAVGKQLKSSWPYGYGKPSSDFTPKVTSGDTQSSICNFGSCNPITFDLASIEECDDFVLHPTTRNAYRHIPAASNYVLTDGAQRRKANPKSTFVRVETNGNILDIANASALLMSQINRNYPNNKFSASTGLKYSDLTTLEYQFTSKSGSPIASFKNTGTADTEGSLDEIYEGCEQKDIWFNSLPFWASDDAVVPVCMYMLDMGISNVDGTPASQPYAINDAMISNYSFADNQCPAPDFSELKSANFEVECGAPPGDTVVLPGRCTFFDTNYLFRQSSTELVFDWSQTSAGKYALKVYGRSQCNPQYGGQLVSFKDETKQIEPPVDIGLNPIFFFGGYTVDNYGIRPQEQLAVRLGKASPTICGQEEQRVVGTKLNLPLESFMRWSDVGKTNPNPLYFFKGRPEWEDGNPSGLIDGEDTSIQCQKFNGQLPPGSVQTDKAEQVLAYLKKHALVASERALTWAATKTTLTHAQSDIVQHIVNDETTSNIPHGKSDYLLPLSFFTAHTMVDLVQKALDSGKMNLHDIFPSGGVPGLTDEALLSSTVTKFNVGPILMHLRYSPKHADSFNQNHASSPGLPPFTNGKDKLYNVYGQSIATHYNVNPALSDPWHHYAPGQGLNTFPQVLPDAWSAFNRADYPFTSDPDSRSLGAVLDWNIDYGIPTLIFHTGRLIIHSPFGPSTRLANEKGDSSDYDQTDAQTQNIFSCDYGHSWIEQVDTAQCPRVYFYQKRVDKDILWLEQTELDSGNKACYGTLTFLGPVYGSDNLVPGQDSIQNRRIKDACAAVFERDGVEIKYRDLANSTPGINPPADRFLCQSTQWNEFQGGLNPSAQACANSNPRTSNASRYRISLYQYDQTTPYDACYLGLDTKQSNNHLKESNIHKKLFASPYPVPRHCGVLQEQIEAQIDNDGKIKQLGPSGEVVGLVSFEEVLSLSAVGLGALLVTGPIGAGALAAVAVASVVSTIFQMDKGAEANQANARTRAINAAEKNLKKGGLYNDGTKIDFSNMPASRLSPCWANKLVPPQKINIRRGTRYCTGTTRKYDAKKQKALLVTGGYRQMSLRSVHDDDIISKAVVEGLEIAGKLFGKLDKKRRIRKQMSALQYNVQHNAVDWNIMDHWDPLGISIARGTPGYQTYADQILNIKTETIRQPSGVDGPEGMVPNVVATESGDGIVLGALEVLKTIYSANDNVRTVWSHVYKSLTCMTLSPVWMTKTSTPTSAAEWIEFVNKTITSPFYHDCTQQQPSLYDCKWNRVDPKPACAYFAPPYDEKYNDNEKDFLVADAKTTNFYKFHACPIQAGCMVRPYGRVVGRTLGDTGEGDNKMSVLYQEAEGYMCAPTIWQTYVYERGEEQEQFLYRSDPGISLAMRKQQLYVTVESRFQYGETLFNPAKNSQHPYQSLAMKRADYYFFDPNQENIFYRVNIEQRPELQSYYTDKFPDVTKIKCPKYVSRRNWNSRELDSLNYYDGPEIFRVVQSTTNPPETSFFPDKAQIDRYNFDITTDSATQFWLKITYASTFNTARIVRNMGFSLSFGCACDDCEPVPFFNAHPIPSQYATEKYAFSKNCKSSACMIPKDATFADPRFHWQPAFSVNPYALTPPVAFSPKAIPQFETTFKTQYKAISNNNDASCSCGGPDSIRFFCDAQPTRLSSDLGTKDFSETTVFEFAQLTFPAKASTSFIACGYSWVNNERLHTPPIGLFMGSLRGKYTVGERSILLDSYGMNNQHVRDHLEGTTGAKPDFSPQADDGLQKRYWFTGNKPFSEDVVEARKLYKNNITDYSFQTILGPEDAVRDINPASHLCGFESCLADSTCTDTPYQVQINQKYNYTNVGTDSDRLLCWRRWYYEYSFDNGCTKWPYGFVQSFEMSEQDRNAFFPPSKNPPDYLMSYCDTFEVGGATRYNYCNDDPFQNNKEMRQAFCSPDTNPMGQYRLDAVMITDHPIDAACSEKMKACLIVPGSPGASSFGAVLDDAPAGAYTNYTMLLAPFNFLAVANSFGYLSRRGQPIQHASGSGRDMDHNTRLNDRASRAYLGFEQSDEIFNMFLNLDSAGDVDTVKDLCRTLVAHLDDSVSGDGSFCPADQYQILAVSNSQYAYRCVDKDWWKPGPLLEREILVRDDGITFEYIGIGTDNLVFETAPGENAHETCVRIEVGGQRFSLSNATFDQTNCRLRNPHRVDRLTPIKFSGGNVNDANIVMKHIPPPNAPDHAAVMILGDDTTFFGHSPTILTDRATFVVDSPVRYDLAAARAEGTVDLSCAGGSRCNVILQQPNETHKPIYFTRRSKVDVIDIGNYTNVFGTSVERRLTSRPVDHSTTAWIITAFLGLLFLLQCTTIIITAIDPHLVEAMVVEALFGDIVPYTGPNSRVFVYSGETPLTLTKTGPTAFVWSPHYANQVDAAGVPKKGSMIVETHFVTSRSTEYQYTSVSYYHLAYDFRIECIKKDGDIPIPHSLAGRTPGLRTVPLGLYHALINA